MDLATHNSSATKIMLGKYDGGSATSYITKAGSEFTYFNLGKNWDDIKSTYRYTDQDMLHYSTNLSQMMELMQGKISTFHIIQKQIQGFWDKN